jgi:hypothetical protein
VKELLSIQALVDLIDDPDDRVSRHVEDELLKRGVNLIPTLEEILEASLDHPEKSDRINFLLSELRYQKVANSLRKWKLSDEKSLLEGLYFVTKYQFPDLTNEEFIRPFTELKEAVWLEISPRHTSFEVIKIFNEIFFKHFKFTISPDHSSTPFDVFINTVLATKEGSEISIGLIYSIVAQSLSIPIYGVASPKSNLPFLLAHLDKNDLLSLLNWGIHQNGVLFYLDIAQEGAILKPNQLELMFRKEQIKQCKSFFEPSPNSTLVEHYLRALINTCEQNIQFRYKVKHLKSLLQIMEANNPG